MNKCKTLIFSWLLVFIFGCVFSGIFAQSTNPDNTFKELCENRLHTNKPNLSLDKKGYYFVDYRAFKLVGKQNEYAIVQLGKRKGSDLFMYIKLSPEETCVEQDKIVFLRFKDGSSLNLKNEYPTNCDGIIVAELDSEDIDQIQSSAISSVFIDSYENDIEFDFTNRDAENISLEIYCLHNVE